MKRQSVIPKLVGLGLALLSSVTFGQAMPGRALSLPGGAGGGNNPVGNPFGSMPAHAGGTGTWANPMNVLSAPAYPANISDMQCSASLAKERELTALLKKKIELLESRLASAKDQAK